MKRRLDAKDKQVGEVQKRKELERRLDVKDNQVGAGCKNLSVRRRSLNGDWTSKTTM